MIVGKNIVVLGSVDWNTNWQTQQRLVTSLGKNNNVIFIENTGVRNIVLSDYARIKDRLVNWKKSKNGFRKINKRISIYSPLLFPFPYNLIFTWINFIIIKSSIKKYYSIFSSNVDIFVTFLPTRLSYMLMSFFKSKINIYYCANEMLGINNENKKIISSEVNFFKKCDYTFVISKNLSLKAERYTKNFFTLPAGVELNKFNYFKTKKKKLHKSKLIVGYVGSITNVFDLSLMEYLAIKNPQFNFILLGRVYINVSNLEKIRNIRFISEIEHSKVPSYMKGFNIGIIPYKVNNFTNSVYSCKLNEYLSMGLPVISTNIKEASIFKKNNKNVISVAKNYYEFNELLKIQIKKNKNSQIKERIKMAIKNSWNERFRNFENIISEQEIKKFFL